MKGDDMDAEELVEVYDAVLTELVAAVNEATKTLEDGRRRWWSMNEERAALERALFKASLVLEREKNPQ
jgi:hypothetical protein